MIRGNTIGNIINRGLAAIQGDCVYYAQEHDSRFELVKARTNGSEEQVIAIEESAVGYINLIEDWIYYCVISHYEQHETSSWGFENASGQIYKVRNDGSGRTLVCGDGASYVNVIDDLIYYCNADDGNSIYKINTDGSNKTKLCDDNAAYINVFSDCIYYCSDGGIYKIDSSGNNKTCLHEADVFLLQVTEDGKYFLNEDEGGTLQLISSDSEEEFEINDAETSSFNVSGDWIYFSYSGSECYKMRIDELRKSKPLEKKNGNEICFINTVGDWLYGTNSDHQPCRIRIDGTGYAMLWSKHHSAEHLRVKFEDGKSYIYRTLDKSIELGAKVKVEGKKVSFLGEIVEKNVKFKKDADAHYIKEVISP